MDIKKELETSKNLASRFVIAYVVVSVSDYNSFCNLGVSKLKGWLAACFCVAQGTKNGCYVLK